PRLGGGTVLQYAEATPPAAPARGPVPYAHVAATPPAPAPAPAPVVQPAPITAAPAGVWVQAGTRPDAPQARRAAHRLGGGGGATVDVAGPGLYRVLVGPWPDAAAAERSRRAVASRGYPEATTISGA